eukprot:scaffold2426_cov84-Isochrysis_galbana.AAC.5
MPASWGWMEGSGHAVGLGATCEEQNSEDGLAQVRCAGLQACVVPAAEGLRWAMRLLAFRLRDDDPLLLRLPATCERARRNIRDGNCRLNGPLATK